jgi:hypothetical protein
MLSKPTWLLGNTLCGCCAFIVAAIPREDEEGFGGGVRFWWTAAVDDFIEVEVK